LLAGYAEKGMELSRGLEEEWPFLNSFPMGKMSYC